MTVLMVKNFLLDSYVKNTSLAPVLINKSDLASSSRTARIYEDFRGVVIYESHLTMLPRRLRFLTKARRNLQVIYQRGVKGGNEKQNMAENLRVQGGSRFSACMVWGVLSSRSS